MTPAEFTDARHAMLMTQAGLARAFGVTRETISRIERGETIPALYALAMAGLTHRDGFERASIADIAGYVDLSYLLNAMFPPEAKSEGENG